MKTVLTAMHRGRRNECAAAHYRGLPKPRKATLLERHLDLLPGVTAPESRPRVADRQHRQQHDRREDDTPTHDAPCHGVSCALYPRVLNLPSDGFCRPAHQVSPPRVEGANRVPPSSE